MDDILNMKKTKLMKKADIKHAIISLLVAATATFLTTLFQGLADLLKAHSTEVVGSVAAAGAYLAQAYRT